MTNGEAWHELAERLLDHAFPGGPDTQVRVVLGDLPEEVAGLVPIPSGWRVVGSSLRRLDIGHVTQMVDVVIDADGEAAAAVATFVEAAEAAGWQPHEDERPVHGGFMGGSGDGEVQSLQQRGLLLRVAAVPRPGRPLDVRLHCNTEEQRGRRHGPHGVPEAATHLPVLRSPPGARLTPRGGGGSMDHYQSDAVVEGDMPVADLHTYLANQLQDASWQLSHQAGDDRAAWSTWQLPDKEWQGFLLVFKAAGGRRTSLLVRVEGADHSDGGGARFTEMTAFGP